MTSQNQFLIESYDAIGCRRYPAELLEKILHYCDDSKIGELLATVSSCRRCASIQGLKRPLNLLCNSPFTDTDVVAELEARRERFDTYIRSNIQSGSRRLEEERFYGDIAREVLKADNFDGFGAFGRGTSIGLHPWADFCMAHWKGPGSHCDVMVVGQDWYTVDQTMRDHSVFTYRYQERSKFWNRFWGLLHEANRSISKDKGFIDISLSDVRYLFTNAMLCFRRGMDVSSSSGKNEPNFTTSSITKCRENLGLQIRAFQPRLVVTCGTTVLNALLWNLGRDGNDTQSVWGLTSALDHEGNTPPFHTIYSTLYNEDSSFIGPRFNLGDSKEFHVIPLFHSSHRFGFRWVHDFEMVARGIRDILSA